MIRSYLAGEMTLDALCRKFRTRRWPAVPPVTPPGMEEAAAAIDDPEPYVPGSFDDVVRAYDRGWITDPDYEALAAPPRRASGASRGDPHAQTRGRRPGQEERREPADQGASAAAGSR